VKHPLRQLKVGGALLAMLLAACGATGPGASIQSPAAASPTPISTPASSPSPKPSLSDLRLVIEDVLGSEVRLARLDATDTASIKGRYDGIVADYVIVLNGTTLQALDRKGKVRKLGQLVAAPDWLGAGTVVVKSDLSQWMYSIHDADFTAHIHLGTATSDKVIATFRSPDGDSTYRPFAWNASGVYLVHQPYGLGGAHPFLDYHFPLLKFDMTTGQMADVTPQCIVYFVLDDGTMICSKSTPDGHIEIRSPSGHSESIQLTIGGAPGTYDAYAYSNVAVSPDGKRLIAGRNGSRDPVINNQMAIADLTSSSAKAFGPLDYLPDAWLPDGRVVATHECVYSGWGGGPCNAGLDGTYFFSPDGTSHTLFHKLTRGAVVGYVW
jgi:hypothetical protein